MRRTRPPDPDGLDPGEASPPPPDDRVTEDLPHPDASPVAPAFTRDDALRTGSLVGPWRIAGTIAAGGCGAVYRARHAVLGRPAAIKVMHAALARSPPAVARFVFEAHAVNRIRHPNIVDVFDIGELADGRPYLAMEILALDNLDDRVRRGGRLRQVDAFTVIDAVGDALVAAHAAGIIHRDIRARNVGFAPAPGGDIVKLLDFGIATLIEPDGALRATPAQRLGTPQGLAPEQIRRDAVGTWTDVYGLGALLFYLLTGRHPFEADDPVALEQLHLDAPPPRLRDRIDAPAPLDALVARALAKDPAARTQTVIDLLAALRAIDRDLPPPAVHVRAVALHVALHGGGAGDLDAIRDAIDHAEHRLAAAGLAFAAATATTVLAVRALAAGAARAAVALAHALDAELRALVPPGVTVAIAVHVDDVELRGAAPIGGPLLHAAAWLSSPPAPGVAVTPAAGTA